MKGKRIVFGILMFLPLAVVLVALPFLPDQNQAHYAFDNQVTRWGSKYEALLLPWQDTQRSMRRAGRTTRTYASSLELSLWRSLI